jgi:spermidine synthase
MEPIEHDATVLRERLARPTYRRAMQTAWRATDLEGFLARYVAGPEFIQSVIKDGSVPLNTDDRNRLEYGFARTVGKKLTGFSITELRSAAAEMSAHRPQITNGEANWDLVEDERTAMHVIQREKVPEGSDWTESHRQRAEALSLIRRGKFTEALEEWSKQPRGPQQFTETSLLAFAHASLGQTEKAEPLIKALSPLAPVEAKGIEAVMHYHSKAYDQAEKALEETMLGLQDDPWGMDLQVDAVLVMPFQLAQHDRSKADAMLKLMLPPLAGLKLHERRKGLTCNVANLANPTALARSIEDFEPHVPWTKPFLELRLRAYAKSGHPLVGIAERDLMRFQVNSGEEAAVAEAVTAR